MGQIDTQDPMLEAFARAKARTAAPTTTGPSDPMLAAFARARQQTQPELRGLSGYRDDIGGRPGGPPAIAQPTSDALNVALGVPQQPQGNPQDFFGAAPAPIPTYQNGPPKPFANPGDLGEGQARTSLHRPDSLIAALEQSRAERAASQQAGFLGRTVGATQTALAGGLASATANIDRLAQQQPISMRPQLPLTSEQVADQMFGVTPEHKQIAQHAGPVENVIAQTVAMPTAFLDPTAIGPMKITGDVGAVLNKELPVFLARLEATAGTKTAKMVEATLHGAGGMGTFSGAHAAMSYPDWSTNPEGGMASVKDAIAHGVVAGAGYGLGGGLLGLLGQIRDERNTKSLEAGKQAQQDAATAFAQGKRQGQWAERENPAATEPYRTSPTTPPEPLPTEPAPTATEQAQAPIPPATRPGRVTRDELVAKMNARQQYAEADRATSAEYEKTAPPAADDARADLTRRIEEKKAAGMSHEEAFNAAQADLTAEADARLANDGAILVDEYGDTYQVQAFSVTKGGPKDRRALVKLTEDGKPYASNNECPWISPEDARVMARRMRQQSAPAPAAQPTPQEPPAATTPPNAAPTPPRIPLRYRESGLPESQPYTPPARPWEDQGPPRPPRSAEEARAYISQKRQAARDRVNPPEQPTPQESPTPAIDPADMEGPLKFAVRSRATGKVYTADSHMAAAQDLYKAEPDQDLNGEWGHVTASGKFLNPRESEPIRQYQADRPAAPKTVGEFGEKAQPERITGVAVRHADTGEVFIAKEAPNHLEAWSELNDKHPGTTQGPLNGTEGYVTSTGRFVDRKEANKIAIASGQATIDMKDRKGGLLTEEMKNSAYDDLRTTTRIAHERAKEKANVPQPEEVQQEVQVQARPDALHPQRDDRAGDAGQQPAAAQAARPLPAQEPEIPPKRVLNQQQPTGKPLTRQSIEKTLMERHEAIAGPQEPNENAGTGGATRAFYKRIPTELSERMTKKELDAAGVQVVDHRNQSGGEDYVHEDVNKGGHGGDWDSYVRELKGDASGPKVAAAKKFFADFKDDPEAAFLTALHDQIPKGGKLKNIQQVKAKLLKAGDTFTVNGIDVRVEDAGDGSHSYLVLKDGDELPETPLEALSTVPMDKGSMGKGEDATPKVASATPDVAPAKPPTNTSEAKATIAAKREAPKPTEAPAAPEKPIPKKTRAQLIDEFHKAFDHVPFMERSTTIALADQLQRASGEGKDEWWSKRFAEFTDRPLKKGEDALHQDSAAHAPQWYSKLRQTVEAKMGGSMDAQALRAMLTNAGVKPEEMEWSRVGDLTGKVSKQQVLDHLDENAVKVEEVSKGNPNQTKLLAEKERASRKRQESTRALRNAIAESSNHQTAEEWINRIVSGGREPIEMREMIQQVPEVRDALARFKADDKAFHDAENARIAQQRAGSTKFQQYQLPGGENYRELLLTMPIKQKAADSTGWRADKIMERSPIAPHMPEYRVYNANGDHISTERMSATAEEAIAKAAARNWKEQQPSFTASHWEEPNVLAHIRFNDRTIGGKKVLFVEEIQSDWHQKGREQGYQSEAKKPKLPDGWTARQIEQRDIDDFGMPASALGKWQVFDNTDDIAPGGMGETAEQAIANTFEGAADAQVDLAPLGGVNSGVPNAPFKKNWHELAMKRVIRYAAENGYDKVAWTPGDIQNERYDLSKQVDSIDVGKNSGDSYFFSAKKGGRELTAKGNLTAAELADHIGKDLTKKALEDLGDSSKPEPSTPKTYSGLDLKVGGSGMRGFYDDILPKATDKIIKKWGGKTGTTPLDVADKGNMSAKSRYVGPTHPDALDKIIANPETDVTLVHQAHDVLRATRIEDEPFGEAMSRLGSQALAEAVGGRLERIPATDIRQVHGFDITPAMREEVLSKGQPLFQGGKRGAVQFLEDGRAIVHAFEGADVSTAWHEIGHVLRRNLPPEEQAIVDAHFGIKPGEKWTREHEEAYSEAWENYGKTGKAPTPELQPLFDKMREWLVGLYTRIKSGLLGKQMDPVMSDHFDRMLVPKNEREAKAALEAKKAAAAEPPPKAEEPPAPEAKPEPIPEGDKPETTGIKNAVSAVTRLKENMGERELPEVRSLEEMYDSGKQAADKDPQATTRLIQEMRDNPEKIISSDEEAGLLLKHKVDLENDLHARLKAVREADTDAGKRAAKLALDATREQIRELTTLTERAGTAAGRALVSRKAMSDMDYSLSHMEAMTEAAKGSPLTEGELAKVKALHEEMQTKLKAVEADRDAAVERAAKAEADRHHEQLLREAAEKDVPPAVREVADRFLKTLGKAADSARARIKARGIRLHAGIDPVEMADYAIIGAEKLARGLSAFADWSGHMIAEIGEWARPHLNDIWDASQRQFEDEASKLAGPARGFVRRKAKEQSPAETVRRMRSRIVDNAKPQDLQPYLQKIALSLIRDGITDREKLLDSLHQTIKAAMPPGKDISRTQVRDILSGYGNFKPLDMDAAKARLREVKGESQKLAQLEALTAGQPPKATGVQRQPPSAEARRLTKLVNEAKKAAGLTQSGPRDLKTVLDTTKTRLKNQINDLQTQIDVGLKDAPRGKPTALTDPEIEALKKQKDAIQAAYDEAFPNVNRPKAPTPPRTDAQKLQTATKAAKTNAESWERRLSDAKGGKFATAGKNPMHSAELDALKAKATAAREAYNELKSLDPAQKATAEAKANQAYRTMLAEREADLQDRIAKGDFLPRPKKAGLAYDNQSIKAKAALEATRQKFNQMAHKFEESQRPLPRKIADTFVKWVRESALSYPSVLEKLTGAAIIRTVSTPIEQAVGAGISKALPRLAAKAPREGVPNIHDAIEAEAAAHARMWTKGMKGSWDMLRNRRTELELALGKDKLPPELTNYLGRLHGALKNPVKEAEFARGLTLRTAHAIRNGIDITDPLVQMRLSNEAYMDANRAIFMQDNQLAAAWNRAMDVLESKDKQTGKPTGTQYIATVLRTELPIVKVPSNVLAEATEVMGGWLTGPAKAAWAYHKGIENLKPAEADIIMRLMKKGSIGAAMLGLGFFGYKSVGGYYEKGEHRRDDEPKPGDIGPVPKGLLHNPYAEAVTFGATIRKAADSKLRKKQEDPNGLGAGILAASVGLIEELPWIREVSTIEKLLDPYQRENALGRAVTGKTVPGVVQWAAKQTDRRDGEKVIRHPAGVWESIKAGIPGLRQSVPEFSTANQAREKMHRLYEAGKKTEAIRLKLQWNREHPKDKIGDSFVGSPAQSRE